ncbi:hypothetical protein K2173_021739 [Erythroxylum novogranatense]|uniref:Bulb-type lectin domain-containing protein n=1 Tax=Erythroxylum novogranatense TaxID=1862640 RepID=A0AAV8TXQ2_9ROSI|nr:hypothetical protein K2173_021739 [Erythroxylum novogranatense]
MASFLFHLILCLLLFLLPSCSVAQTGRDVRVGDSLTAAAENSSWISPSGEFAFGFYQLESNKDLYLLAIWYAKIQQRTIVWYANEGILAPKQSKVELNSSQGLVLIDDRGNQLWTSPTKSGVVAFGSMRDSGNFVLQDSSSDMLWESFNDPADTILPGQYYYPKTSAGDQNWTALWSQPDDICISNRVTTGSGTCGYNSICTLQTDKRPSCHCPDGYSLLDPNDSYGACKPNYTQICGEDEGGPVENLYDFEELTNIDWPEADYALLQPFNEGQCRQSCLHDCLCAVAIFRSGDMCWKKSCHSQMVE